MPRKTINLYNLHLGFDSDSPISLDSMANSPHLADCVPKETVEMSEYSSPWTSYVGSIERAYASVLSDIIRWDSIPIQYIGIKDTQSPCEYAPAFEIMHAVIDVDPETELYEYINSRSKYIEYVYNKYFKQHYVNEWVDFDMLKTRPWCNCNEFLSIALSCLFYEDVQERQDIIVDIACNSFFEAFKYTYENK